MMKIGFASLLIALLALPFGGVAAQEDGRTPPASYEEVAAQFGALEQDALAASEQVIDLFLARDFETLYARLDDGMRALVSEKDLEKTYAQITASAPIGPRLDDRVLLLNPQVRATMATYAWGELQIKFTVALDQAGQIAGMSLEPVQPLPTDPAADFASSVTFRLPVDGLWYVGWGGPDALHNYHVVAPPQRHAYDFLVWQAGSTFSGDGATAEDYYAYGQPVYAPADGTVIRAVDGLPDVLPQVETDAEHPAGNHVVIQVAEESYLFIAHLQPGSVLVAEGDAITAGQEIGRVGNSGNTSEPHLHIHLQNTPEMFTYAGDGTITGLSDAIGLPLEFSAIRVNGEPVERGIPLGGQFVQADGV